MGRLRDEPKDRALGGLGMIYCVESGTLSADVNRLRWRSNTETKRKIISSSIWIGEEDSREITDKGMGSSRNDLPLTNVALVWEEDCVTSPKTVSVGGLGMLG